MKDYFNHDVKIGDKVKKISGKPFKSRNVVNTVKGVTTNPETGKPAFIFFEDDSNVEQWRCTKYTQGVDI